MNNKFKTMLCRHFETSGQCQMGSRCHFAHGLPELRGANEPLPPEAMQMMPINMPFSNYKTVKCKNFEAGLCKYGDTCCFAHGDVDQRSAQPIDPIALNKYYQQLQQQYQLQDLNNRIIAKQLQTIIENFEQLDIQQELILKKLIYSRKLLEMGSITQCAQLIDEIINNDYNTSQENQTYQQILQSVYSIATEQYQLYLQQISLQQQEQQMLQQMTANKYKI